MFRDFNLRSFLSGYGHSMMSKTLFMISGANFILTLTISISKFCKLGSWILKKHLSQEVHQTLNCGLDIRFLKLFYECDLYGYLISDCEISKLLEHKKTEM